VQRVADGCADSDNNAADFATGTPTPQNSFSPPVVCFAGKNSLGVSLVGSGSGSVSSLPSGIKCGGGGSSCSAQFTSGTVVHLYPLPVSAGSVFAGWSGACSGTGDCSVSLDADKVVTARFERVNPRLSVSFDGTGAGSVASSPAGIQCGAVCAADFPSNTVVTLTATPLPGSNFNGWGGACSGTGSCTVTLSRATSVTATFTRIPHRRTVSLAGAGKGSVKSSPSGISCGTTCDVEFAPGTVVTLAAFAGRDSTFAGWSGACSGFATMCVVSLSEPRSVTARFARTNRPPSVAAIATSGTRGKPIRLAYRLSDDTGATRERIVVYRGLTAVRTISTNLHATARGSVHHVIWRPSALATGTFRFCVTSWDKAGNQSRPSCAPVRST
jgi:hypothetical protein